MDRKLPFLFAILLALPAALFLVIIVLLGLKLKVLGGKDVSIIALAAAAGFLILVIFLQKRFRKKTLE